MKRNFLTSCLSLFGLASLSFLLGAAVIFFDLPSSTFLRKAFVGGVSWYEQKEATPLPEEQLPPLTVGQIDNAGKTCDGFTLCMYGGDSRAVLINMRGEEIHQWHVPFSQIWPAPPHLRGRIHDASVYFNDGHLYPNGDLLVVIEGPINLSNPSNGYGLVKLDKDSRVLWKYAEKCHHDVDVAEDGTIYALVNEIVEQVPPRLAYIPTPCMVDFVEVISPQGKKKKRIPLLEALQDSPYAALFCMLERPKMSGGAVPGGARTPLFVDDALRRDVLHTNAIKVLSRALAPKFPLFKEGQLLISVRHLDALVVLDPDCGKVVWAARGPWRAQHDPSFLDNGHLLLFDNLGSPRGSRVLEYDPRTQAFPWSYPGDKGTHFLSKIRGMSQRLPNGNTLVVNSDAGEVFEVAPDREVVWSCSCGHTELYRARRYTAEQLLFLRGNQHARP
ncbi:MAG: arylsulfotransferase family protein [Gemmataceae bacterium]